MERFAVILAFCEGDIGVFCSRKVILVTFSHGKWKQLNLISLKETVRDYLFFVKDTVLG